MLMGKREELKNRNEMNCKQFPEYYEIPYRTIQDWNIETRNVKLCFRTYVV